MLHRVIHNLPVLTDLFVAAGAFLPGQLMYSGVGEPMTIAQPHTMTVTFFHYAAVRLSLACFGHRYNLPLVIRSGLCPLLNERISSPIGHAHVSGGNRHAVDR